MRVGERGPSARPLVERQWEARLGARSAGDMARTVSRRSRCGMRRDAHGPSGRTSSWQWRHRWRHSRRRPLGNPKAGEKIFKTKCSQCHTIEEGRRPLARKIRFSKSCAITNIEGTCPAVLVHERELSTFSATFQL